MNPLIGMTVVGVYLTKNGDALKFEIENAEPVIAHAFGDCCSITWIESLDMPEMLLGTVRMVEDLAMPDLGALPGCDFVQYYGCKITTEKGACVIDYRNDSNGYYGGDLDWSGPLEWRDYDWKILAILGDDER